MSEETTTTTQEAAKCGCRGSFVQDNIMTRLKQESTWRGIITVATLLGWRLAPDEAELIITAGASLVGTINILKRD
jgi:hypothetical protein